MVCENDPLGEMSAFLLEEYRHSLGGGVLGVRKGEVSALGMYWADGSPTCYHFSCL